MKNLVTTTVISLVLFIGLNACTQETKKVTKSKETAAFSKESRYDEKDRKEGLDESLHQDPSQTIRPDLFKKSIDAFMAVQNGPGALVGANVSWKQIGPAPATVNEYLAGNGQRPGPNGAAVIDMVIDPSGSSDDIVYAITNDGGVWKTTDGGNLWVPKTDHLGTLSFGAIALDPSNSQTIYAATGNIFNNGYFKAIGIYVSQDGGDSWTLTTGSSVFEGIGINKMIIPSSGIIVVASQNGLFRSTDSGNSFAQVNVNGGTGAYITDLDIQENGSTMWASVSGQGIFASTDDGASFGENLWGSGHGSVPSNYSFVSLGVSKGGQTLYANAALNPSVGVYKSIDGGTTWSDISANATPNVSGLPSWRQVANCQCGYDQTLGVDPSDSNRIYMGFQDMWLSEDGGDTWLDVSYSHAQGVAPYTVELMHVDHHALVFSPPSHRTEGQATRIWVGNDGGIWSSQNAGVDWQDHNSDPSGNQISFATNLFRGIDIGRGAGNNKYTYGGMQDTGTAADTSDNDEGKPQPWNEWGGGDGGQAAVDWQNPKYAYGQWGGGPIYTHDGGKSFNWSSIDCSSGSAGNYQALETCPTNGYVYLGASCGGNAALLRSENNGQTFTSYHTFSSVPGVVKSIGVTPADANTIYVSLSNGSIQKLIDNGGSITATDVSIANAIAYQVPSLAVNQNNTDIVVAVYAGYSGQSSPNTSKHVYLSFDGGSSWEDISGFIPNYSIPDMPIYSAVFDVNTTPNSILVSSDLGVFRTYDFGLTWHVAGSTLPNVHTVDLEIDATVNPSLIKAGTYGRSAWESSLPVGEVVFGQYSPNFLDIGKMNWKNNSDEDLTVSWISNNGTQTQYATIPANGNQWTQYMYFTGVSVVKDQSGNIVLPYIINGGASQVVTFSQTAVNLAKTNALKGYPGLRSYPGGHSVANFEVINNSSQTLYINWIKPDDGTSDQIAQLDAGKSTPVEQVYFGGTFTLTDTNNRVVGFFVASDEPNQSITMTDALINSFY